MDEKKLKALAAELAIRRHISSCASPHGAKQPEIRLVEGLQGRHQRAESGVSGPNRGGGVDALDKFSDIWDEKYPQISKSWRAHWENLNTFFGYPPDIRKAIYTTNAIESLNSVIRQAIKKRKVFPTDDSVRKVIYLAIQSASKKWSMPIQNWR